jgi:hypothetical protein
MNICGIYRNRKVRTIFRQLLVTKNVIIKGIEILRFGVEIQFQYFTYLTEKLLSTLHILLLLYAYVTGSRDEYFFEGVVKLNQYLLYISYCTWFIIYLAALLMRNIKKYRIRTSTLHGFLNLTLANFLQCWNF